MPTIRLLVVALVATLVSCWNAAAADGRSLADSLAAAGKNRAQIELALSSAPDDQKEGMQWLVAHMPARDLDDLSAEYLLLNCDAAYKAWRSAPWHDSVSKDLFFDCILPYACINETRDQWRALLAGKCKPMVEGETSPAKAAASINRELFPLVGVKYSTKRKKADQSPAESMESGLASCTGLSILLIDACRSMGIPARFAGTPLWLDKSGNHSWVEVWDDGWHFTGAAEATGDELDKGWFTDRAATAKESEPMHAIYAVTWRDSPVSFPAAWRDDDNDPVRAVNVTSRYASPSEGVPSGQARVRLRVSIDGQRVAQRVTLSDSAGKVLLSANSKDEGFDSNDHLWVVLPIGTVCNVKVGEKSLPSITVERDEQLVDLLGVAADTNGADDEGTAKDTGSTAIKALRNWLANHSAQDAIEESFAQTPLSRREAAQAAELIWKRHLAEVKLLRKKELDSKVIEVDGVRMPIWFAEYGKAPTTGHSLFISMHGGGGAPKEVNDQQWKNQQRLYQPEEGIYVAPRAPTDNWNLWHEAHIDPLFTRLIEDMVIVHGVDPERVYIMGYSAGGDGVYQLAPRMSDQLAAAAMMAGHPNETKPDGLRNLPFALHVGANDTPYNRNTIGAKWKEMLAELAASEPGAYPHLVEIHPGKGHWMDREDASAVAWMAKFTRNARPEKIVWLQDDVTHNRFYWLATDAPKGGSRASVTRDGSTFSVESVDGFGDLSLLLDDSMCDLDGSVTLRRGDVVLFKGTIPRTIDTISRTLRDRWDPKSVYCSRLSVPLAVSQP